MKEKRQGNYPLPFPVALTSIFYWSRLLLSFISIRSSIGSSPRLLRSFNVSISLSRFTSRDPLSVSKMPLLSLRSLSKSSLSLSPSNIPLSPLLRLLLKIRLSRSLRFRSLISVVSPSLTPSPFGGAGSLSFAPQPARSIAVRAEPPTIFNSLLFNRMNPFRY